MIQTSYFVVIALSTLICGKQVKNVTFQPLRTERFVRDGEFPFVVSIELLDTIQFPMCVGTIIGLKTVVTSGHCLGFRWKNLIIVAGTRILSPSSVLDMIVRHVISYWLHPRFQTQLFSHDVAILTVSERFAFESYPIAAATITMGPIEDGILCEYVGWGIEYYFGFNTTNIPLKATSVRSYNSNWCGFIYQADFNQQHLCAQKSNYYPKPCAFDIGSPLICNNALVAIGTKRFKCNDLAKPHVFMMVTKLEKFVRHLEDRIHFNAAMQTFECSFVVFSINLYTVTNLCLA